MKKYTFEKGERMIVERVLSHKDVVVVAIAGLSCSGKTFLADNLEKKIKGSMNIPLDSYFRDSNDPELPHDKNGFSSYDEPGSYQVEELKNDIAFAIGGNEILIPDYDIRENRRIAKNLLRRKSSVIILEGLFAVSIIDEMMKDMEYSGIILLKNTRVVKVFLDTEISLCLSRRTARDVEMLGVTKKQVSDLFSGHIVPRFRRYILPQKNLSDIIIGS